MIMNAIKTMFVAIGKVWSLIQGYTFLNHYLRSGHKKLAKSSSSNRFFGHWALNVSQFYENITTFNQKQIIHSKFQ